MNLQPHCNLLIPVKRALETMETRYHDTTLRTNGPHAWAEAGCCDITVKGPTTIAFSGLGISPHPACWTNSAGVMCRPWHAQTIRTWPFSTLYRTPDMVPLQVTHGRSGGVPVPPKWTPGATPGRRLAASCPAMPSKLGKEPCLQTPVGCGLLAPSSAAEVLCAATSSGWCELPGAPEADGPASSAEGGAPRELAGSGRGTDPTPVEPFGPVSVGELACPLLGGGNGCCCCSTGAANALPTEPSLRNATASDLDREIPN